MPDFGDMNAFLRDKLRVPTMTTNDAPDGGDRQLQDAADELAAEAGDLPYSPPLPVPIGRPEDLSDVRRQPASEVWLINPPATLPGLGVLVGGGASEKGSQFAINSIRVDNLTNQWMYFPEIGAFVPPFWYGRVLKSDGGRVQRVRFETPTGITANVVSATQLARVIFSNAPHEEVDGEEFTGSTTSAAVDVNIFGDAGQAQTQAYSADSLSAALLGLITNARLQALRGDLSANVDRLATVKTSGTNFSGAAYPIPIQAVGAYLFDDLSGVYSNLRGSRGIADAVTGALNLATAQWYAGGGNPMTWQRMRVPTTFKQLATSAIGAGSTVTVWTPAAGLRPRLMGWVVTGSSGLVDAAVTFFETSTTGTFMGEVGFLAGIETPSYVNFLGGGPIVSTSSAVIVAFSSTGITLRGTLFGTEE